jgi:hypothetical protein
MGAKLSADKYSIKSHLWVTRERIALREVEARHEWGAGPQRLKPNFYRSTCRMIQVVPFRVRGRG